MLGSVMTRGRRGGRSRFVLGTVRLSNNAAWGGGRLIVQHGSEGREKGGLTLHGIETQNLSYLRRAPFDLLMAGIRDLEAEQSLSQLEKERGQALECVLLK